LSFYYFPYKITSNYNIPHQFTIVSWNAQNVNKKFDDVQLFLYHYQPSVLCIQEPWCNDSNDIPVFENYNVEYIKHVNGKTGILFYVHTSVLYSYISRTYSAFTPTTNTMCIWLQLSSPMLPTPLLLGTCYLSNKLLPYPSYDFMNFINSVHQASSTHPTYPIIIIGDFNSRHKHWDTSVNSLGPSVYHNLLLNNNHHFHSPFLLLNKHFSTSILPAPTRPASNSVIDLAFASPNSLPNISSFHVLSDCYLLSDHYPIQINFIPVSPSSVASVPRSPPHTRWSIQYANWLSFTAYLDKHLPRWFNEYHQFKNTIPSSMPHPQLFINTSWNKLRNIIVRGADLAVGTSTIKSTSKHWYTINPKLPMLHKRYRSIRTVYFRRKRQGVATDALYNNYKIARNKYLQSVYHAKQLCWAELANSVDNKNKVVWSSWRKCNSIGPSPFPSFIHPATKLPPTSHQQSLDNFAYHLLSVSTIDYSMFNTTMDNIVDTHLQSISTPPTYISPLPFSMEHVERACSYVRTSSSSGPGDISPYFLRYGGKQLVQSLFLLFSLCYTLCVLPSAFVNANVSPIYKKEGDKCDGNFYALYLSPI